ncbi:DNA polymerase beta-like [Rhopalosiphum padi]|uniref:DNA polymerase beta-like n=1 Tax=Rhopalosiphum padi TaxID=40932 RepID=UPI00298DE23B|nr:DNA polymerase beta-like [Rhopalosiphum padi]XP_060842276.1 DNA polymerase beta-like [Rhopalosiphum padi]
MSKRKAPSDSTNPNHDFCEFLTELADYEKNVTRNIYKCNAYRKAASALAKHGKRIKSGEEAQKLDGIGDKISKKIDEFLGTGKLKKLDNIRSDETSVSIKELTRVSGIGPAKAKELYDLGITNIDVLLKHQDKLNHHQTLGLKYLNDFEEKIPRSEVIEVEQIIKKTLFNLDPKYKVTICGSYRRGKEFSGDIDTLISHPSFMSHDNKKKCNKLQVVVDILKKNNLITETISLGDAKFMGVCKVNRISRRLDIRLNPYDQFYCAVLYFTGSDLFNKQMRDHALHQGFTLNEYTLRPMGSTGIPGEPVEINSEEDIFDYLDYPYKKPEERNL